MLSFLPLLNIRSEGKDLPDMFNFGAKEPMINQAFQMLLNDQRWLETNPAWAKTPPGNLYDHHLSMHSVQ